jgi:hypothetical protein
MESSANYHFVKPSGKHTNRFIKASNVMEKGAEISFFALNLFKRINIQQIDNIYTDTAGIFPLAYELLAIIRRFKEDTYSGFIDSFGSYGGLPSYTFSGGPHALVLISASTSDYLSNKLRSVVGLSGAKIMSIFSASPDAEPTSTLISFKDFTDKYDNLLFTGFKSSDEHECDLCIYEKSIPLSLANSQFIFEAPETELYLPLAKDSDATLKKIISNYKDSSAFKCLYDGLEGKTVPTPEYFIDVSELVRNNTNYQNKIDNVVTRSFPLSADLIVHTKEQGAADVALHIKNEVKKLGKSVKSISIDDMGSASPQTGIVVVAGSIQSGKSLLDMSRQLRKYSKLPITYIVGFAKYNDPASYSKLKKDLEFNNGSKELGNHQFIAVDEIILPINEHRVNSWEREQEVLKKIKALEVNTSESAAAIDERESDLRQATDVSQQGIGKSIFLKRLDGKDMQLGATFAFWSNKDTDASFKHQATVFYTMSSILQNLRYKKSSAGNIPLGHGYVVKQLDVSLRQYSVTF